MASKSDLFEPPLCGQIYQALTEEIADGRLPPGAMLSEKLIAERFAAAPEMVRKVLDELSYGGLTERRPGAGAIVVVQCTERLANLFEFTAEIEAVCVRLATNRLRILDRYDLQETHQAAAACVDTGDVEGYRKLNLQFHEIIYRGARNREILAKALVMRKRLAAFRSAQLNCNCRMRQSFEEHGEILWALERRDGDEAASCARAHVLGAANTLLAHMREIHGA
jgi:DNA-binding GntR family transcriptional regulator